MTQTTKHIFEKHEVRYSKKQKSAFIDYVKSVCDHYGYSCNIEKGTFGSRNIVVGDPDRAKVVYTAHYDTCPRLPFPNFITPKNFLIYLLYQLLIVAVFFAAAGIIGVLCGIILTLLSTSDSMMNELIPLISPLIYLGLVLIIFAGPANKHTANDNTSGVTTLLDIMTNLPQDQRHKVAFVFFDLEEAGLFGSSSFANKHKNVRNNSLVLNFDCVSDGETMLFALKKSTRKYADLLERAFVSDSHITVDIAKKGVFYPSDNANFKGGIGVAALKKSKLLGTLYMDRIHTKRDTVYREENISFLTNGAIRLAQIL